jgi:hypothetical protein
MGTSAAGTFELRITITGLCLLGYELAPSADPGLKIVMPRTGPGQSLTVPHSPQLVYDPGYAAPGGPLGGGAAAIPLDEQYVAIKGDPSGTFDWKVTRDLLDLSDTFGARLGSGRITPMAAPDILSYVTVDAGMALCVEPGNWFVINKGGVPRRIDWLLQWSVQMPSASLTIMRQGLRGSTPGAPVTLYPQNGLVEIAVVQHPHHAMPPMKRGDPVDHFLAHYALLGMTTGVPTFEANRSSGLMCKHPPIARHPLLAPHLLSDAYYCMPPSVQV